MTYLRVAFRNYVKVPKMMHTEQLVWNTSMLYTPPFQGYITGSKGKSNSVPVHTM